ncbi:transposase family protein [Parendozoicomonas sp. Alg238-R29]|uniref:transposase family protein n=1 Tax=Parendozoicomonas sp. Alg238-R29 TaxID=2993446 RepID=UPI00248F178E|nr:transposase family protein [Parendozoicomonas sp. Alg238-R29]
MTGRTPPSCPKFPEFNPRFLELAAGIPSKSTFRRVFCLLDPVAFEACFTAWIKQTLTEIAGSHHLAVDGKILRGSRSQGKKPVLLVSVWNSELGSGPLLKYFADIFVNQTIYLVYNRWRTSSGVNRKVKIEPMAIKIYLGIVPK